MKNFLRECFELLLLFINPMLDFFGLFVPDVVKIFVKDIWYGVIKDFLKGIIDGALLFINPVLDFFGWFVPDVVKEVVKDIWYGKDYRSDEEIERLWEEATRVFDDIDDENAEAEDEDKDGNNVAEDEWEFEDDED